MDTKNEFYYNGIVFLMRRLLTALILVMLRG
jgi:hypothetical protein